jgi:bilirubin oxidase
VQDVGQNSWELWVLEAGGGWFHPVHIHLIDFLVIQRDGSTGVHTYEQLTPKDVRTLHLSYR